MLQIKRLACAFLLASSISVMPVQSSEVSFFSQEVGTHKNMKVRYSFSGERVPEIRKLLNEPEMKRLCILFQPTLQIEDMGSHITINATQGAYDFAVGVFGRFNFINNALLQGRLNVPMRDIVSLEQLLPKGFHPAVYTVLHPDTAGYLPDTQDRYEAALSHFMNFGRVEGRSFIPKEFNPESYLLCNPDVREEALKQQDPWAFAAYHHYVLSPHENRSYLPRDFEEEIYLKLHSDVHEQATTSGDPFAFARQHYLSFGKTENRAYKVSLPEDFSWQAYCRLHPDILDVGSKAVSFPARAAWHYTHYGYFEKRPCKQED